MAGETAVPIGASDPFGLSTDFKEQSVSIATNNSFAQVMNALGDLAFESAAFDIRTDVTAEYKYQKTASPDMIGDLGTIATAMWAHGTGLYAIENLSLAFSAAEFATITITGHQHGTTTHAAVAANVPPNWDWSGIFAAAQTGFGIPALTTTTHEITAGTLSAVTDLTVNIVMTHVDHIDGTGTHFHGSNTGCRVDVSASGIGNFSDLATVGSSWVKDSSTESDSNSSHDTWAYTGHLYLTRN